MGLTEQDVAVIQDTWSSVKSVAKLRDHGVNFFMMLFDQHPDWREEYFGYLGDEPIEELKKDPKLRAHAGAVMSRLDFWVSNLDELDMVVSSVRKLGQNHKSRNVYGDQFEAIEKVILSYLAAGLGELFTSDAEEAWTKLLDTVVDLIKAEE